MHARVTTLSIPFLLAFSPSLFAQAINIDYGVDAGTPADTFGAASGQAGVWNSLSGFEDEPVFLQDTSGNDTEVGLIRSLPFGQALSDAPETTGDMAALLDDYLDLHSVPAEFMFTDIQPGEYLLYAYSWPPDNSNYRTSLWVNDDSDNAQLVGGAWPGGFQQGITHAVHTAQVNDDRTLVLHTFGLTKGTLNGLQLVPQAYYLAIEPEGPLLKVVQAHEPAQTLFRMTLNDEALAEPPMLHYRADASLPYVSIPMTMSEPDVWAGTLPGFACTDRPEWYISAVGTLSGVRLWPVEAFDSPLGVRVKAFDGDMNGDESIDARDIAPFVAAVLAESGDLTDICHGDFDDSGAMDVADVGGLVDAILAD